MRDSLHRLVRPIWAEGLAEILSKRASILVSRLLIGCRRRTRIHLQNTIIVKAGMNVNMKVRHFLKGRLADGVPKAHPFVWEYCADRAGDARNRPHERSCGRVVKVTHVSKVATRNDKGVAGVKLPKVEKGDRRIVLGDDARSDFAARDIAKHAAIPIHVLHRPNENKMSDGGRKRASLEVKVRKSS